MVVEEHFVTRRPVLFLLIVIAVLVAIFIPAKYVIDSRSQAPVAGFVNESYKEIWHWFNVDSPLTADEKKEIFDLKYKGSVVQWSGTFLDCRPLQNLYSVSVSERGTDFSDVIFSTKDNCTAIPVGSELTYRMHLVDLRVNVFVGKDGEIIS